MNLGWGCRKVDAACQNYYMFRMSRAFGRDPAQPRTFDSVRAFPIHQTFRLTRTDIHSVRSKH